MKNNIEEDIVMLNKIKKTFDIKAPNVDVRNNAQLKVQAIENILEEYKRVKQENEEYKKQLDLGCADIDEAIKNARETIAKANKYDELKKKVKDKLNDIDEVLDNTYEKSAAHMQLLCAKNEIKELFEEEEV